MNEENTKQSQLYILIKEYCRHILELNSEYLSIFVVKNIKYHINNINDINKEHGVDFTGIYINDKTFIININKYFADLKPEIQKLFNIISAVASEAKQIDNTNICKFNFIEKLKDKIFIEQFKLRDK